MSSCSSSGGSPPISRTVWRFSRFCQVALVEVGEVCDHKRGICAMVRPSALPSSSPQSGGGLPVETLHLTLPKSPTLLQLKLYRFGSAEEHPKWLPAALTARQLDVHLKNRQVRMLEFGRRVAIRANTVGHVIRTTHRMHRRIMLPLLANENETNPVDTI